jgi:hypothetical protein
VGDELLFDGDSTDLAGRIDGARTGPLSMCDH